MKKLLLTLFLTVTAAFSFAQLSKKTTLTLPDETAVVKDSLGRQYNYDDWKFMVESRKFSIHGTTKVVPNSKYHEFLLYPLYDTSGHRIFTAEMKRRKPEESEQFPTGSVFKPLKERDITGNKFDMKKTTGKVYVIAFWYIACLPCRTEIPDLNELVARYKDNSDVVFIGLCLDETMPIENFQKLTPFNYHQISDRRSLIQSYGVHQYPTSVVVNRDGKVAYSSIGGISSNPYWIGKTIDEALKAPASAVQ